MAALVLPGTAAAQTEARPETPEGWRVTRGGELRPFLEHFSNEEFGDTGAGRDTYVLSRAMAHVEANRGTRIRLRLELKSGLIAGRQGPPRPPDEDRLDLHQAFVEFAARGGLTIRAGRQELRFGASRLVAVREGPNVRQSFDGLRLSAHRGAWQVDGIAVMPATTRPGVFDDAPEWGRALWGGYAVRQGAGGTTLDLYYLGHRRGRARFAEGTARELRHSWGVRVARPRRSGHVDFDVEAVAQAGRFGQAAIRAWTIATEIGVTATVAGRPLRAGAKADVTSGDAAAGDARLGTFNALYPRGAYFGLVAPSGPYNHRDVHPEISAEIHPRLTLTADALLLWSHRLTDGLYDVPGNLFRPPAPGAASRQVARQAGVEAVVALSPAVTATVNLARVWPGAVVRATGSARTITYAASWLTYRF